MLLCAPGGMGTLYQLVRTCQHWFTRTWRLVIFLISLLGFWISVTTVGCRAGCAYVISSSYKAWILRLEQASLGRDTLHASPQFPTRGTNASCMIKKRRTQKPVPDFSGLLPKHTFFLFLFLLLLLTVNIACYLVSWIRKLQGGSQTPTP